MTSEDIDDICRILSRARLPREVIAMAYNILSDLEGRDRTTYSFHLAPPGLLATAALTLAAAYMHDRPPSFSHWSRAVCDSRWSPGRIDKTALLIMAAHDWRLHPFSSPSAIESARATFNRSFASSLQLDQSSMAKALSRSYHQPQLMPPMIYINGALACWKGDPPHSRNGAVQSDSAQGGSRYLPLL